MYRKFAALAAAVALGLSGCSLPEQGSMSGSGSWNCESPNQDGSKVCHVTMSPAPVSPSTAPSTTPSPTGTATPDVTTSPSVTATPAPSLSASATPSPTVTPTSTATPTASLPSGATFKQIDGGPDYNAKFTSGLPTDPGFFPIGVWYESTYDAASIAFDKATGLNVYMASTENINTAALRANGMYVFPWSTQAVAGKGSETAGYTLEDEPDMLAPGWWSAPTPEQIKHMDAKLANRSKDGRANYTNYGLGVLANDDRDPATSEFVLKYSDYISADCYMYYYTGVYYESSRCIGKGDQRLTIDQQERARNYGIMVERMRGFAKNTKPVWSFIEIAGITPGQLRASMWHSIISGARGIVFFNHQFEGSCQTQHALREACYASQRAMVQQVTAQIRELAPIINAPDVVGLVTNTAGVTSNTKWNNGQAVIFAGNNDNAARSATFTVTGRTDGTVTVLGENRTLTMTGGKFTDQFANGDAVHIYKIN